MPHATGDHDLANSLDTIRAATTEGTIKWKRLLHPVDGDLLAYRGVGNTVGEDPFTPTDRAEFDAANLRYVSGYVYLLGDEMLTEDDPDIEEGPSITRYHDIDDKHFDAMVLAKFSAPPVQEALAKLTRLVRKVAE